MGFALDLTTGWDLSRPDDRDEAMQLQEEHRPKLLVGIAEMHSVLAVVEMLRGLEGSGREAADVA